MTIAIVRTCSEKQISLECYTSEPKIRKFEIVGVTGVFYLLEIPLTLVGFRQKRQTLLSFILRNSSILNKNLLHEYSKNCLYPR